MAGACIPLTPAVHQMIDIGPVPRFEDAKRAIEFPIVRDMDTNMYERQDGTSLEIGSYAHRAILYDPEDLPSVEEAALSPTEFPFTQEDFEPQLEQALELMPEIVGDESVGIKYAINGILSLTPDGMPILGETPEVKGLWSAAAVWVKEGPGVGKALAEWMVHGESEIDLHSSDVARFHDHHQTSAHVKARTAEGFNKTYGIVHPLEQWESNRDVRLSPFHAARAGARRRLLRGSRLGAPAVVRVEHAAPRGVRRPGRATRGRVGLPLVVADHQRRAPRDARAGGDVRPLSFRHLRRLRPGCARRASARVDATVRRRSGRVVYTPWLSQSGGFKSDLTIMRLGDELFRVVTGGAHGMADKKWLRDHLPDDGSAQLADLTSAWCTLGIWGPRARDILASATRDDVSHEGFPFGTCRTIEIGPLRVLASRISYVGDLGWELYVPIEQGARLWDILWEAGRAHRAVPAGIGVYGTTGRLEKCYRAYGTELESEYTVVEAGMGTPKVKDHDFVGKEAYLRAREDEPATILCTLTVDDHASSNGVARYPQGREPVVTAQGDPSSTRTGAAPT